MIDFSQHSRFDYAVFSFYNSASRLHWNTDNRSADAQASDRNRQNFVEIAKKQNNNVAICTKRVRN